MKGAKSKRSRQEAKEDNTETLQPSKSTKSAKTSISSSTSANEPVSTLRPYLRISSCSYEGSLFGWNLEFDDTFTELFDSLEFGFNVIKAPLKSLSISSSGKYLAIGGVDERIRVFNVEKNKSVCELVQHAGDITCLAFAGDEYVLSGSSDKTVLIWRVKDWQCLHSLEHPAPILDLSIHPSSKVCLTLTNDRGLKIWDLMRGTCAYTQRLKHDYDRVSWNADGSAYLLQGNRILTLFNAATNEVMFEFKTESRINKACFVRCGDEEDTGYYVVVIYENMELKLYDRSGSEISMLSFASTSYGKLRHMYVQTPSKVGDPEVDDMIASDGQSIVLVTSTSKIIVLNAQAIKDRLDLKSCTQAIIDELKSEPRLTAVVAW